MAIVKQEVASEPGVKIHIKVTSSILDILQYVLLISESEEI